MRRWGWWFLIGSVVALGWWRLRFETDVLQLLPANLPVVQTLQLQQRYFAPARALYITVAGSDRDQVARGTQAVAAQLRQRPDLAGVVRWQPPWIENPHDAAENVAWLWLQQPPEDFARWAQRFDPSQIQVELTEARERLATSLDPQEIARTSYDPLGLIRLPGGDDSPIGFDEGVGVFRNAEETFRLIEVEPADPRMNYRAAASWLEAVQRVAAAALADSTDPETTGAGPPAVRLAFTGNPAFVAEISAGMERDLRNSVLATAAMIAAMFWIAHRSWRPLGWLLVSLALTLGLTLALGGLLLGTLNVISVGFAAVLMGLAVDYGLVSYQEAVAHPGSTPPQVRAAVARGVWYSAGATAGTFLLLGFAGLPGLAQLGQLTALGLLLGAVVMLYFFLPRVCPANQRARAPREVKTLARRSAPFLRLAPTGIVLGAVILTLALRDWPTLTKTDDPLRPRNSFAYAALDELQSQMGRANDKLSLLLVGNELGQMGRDLDRAQQVLSAARDRGEVKAFELPVRFWPRPDFAQTNRAAAAAIATRAEEIRAEALQAGFNANALALFDGVTSAWRKMTNSAESAWPANASARWLASRFSARTEDGRWLALGAVEPNADSFDRSKLRLPANLSVGSWESLSRLLADHVAKRVTGLMIVIGAAVAGCLWLAFRRVQEVILGLAALALSFGLLLAVMSWVGVSWNLLSLVALPLLFGASVDSTIHMQLALRRHRGNWAAVWRTTGKALLLCAGANIAGFGSLAWSSNLGLASLDVTCAVGVACVFVVCVGLLPSWWLAVTPETPSSPRVPHNPSRLYGAGLWRLGLKLARRLPGNAARALASSGAAFYRWTQPARFQVVVENMLPCVGGDPALARDAAKRNFREFAAKLVDLWRCEAGVDYRARIRPGQGWEHFQRARQSGRGLLLVTPHLGNWEFGGLLLAQQGIRPLVLTAPEPGEGFTEIRAQARARLGADTVVVGEDPFAVVPVIRHLQEGGVAALLMDRPTPATAALVEFLGRPFHASVAAAELARATRCLIVPVFVVRVGQDYVAHLLAPIDHDPRTLRDRGARLELTRQILRAFEPAVRKFPDQWFHFVPIWPGRATASSAPAENAAPSMEAHPS